MKEATTYDAKYIAWLKINHPEADLTIYSTSLLDHFPDVSALNPLPVVEKKCLTSNTEVDEVSITETQTSGLSPEQIPRDSGTDSSPTGSKETEAPSSRLKPQANLISKYLVQYIPTQPQRKKAAETRVTGLRVLTSSEGITILNEKEEKKRKEREEKEKRKQERLEKKKQKDNLSKKKASQKLNQGAAKRQTTSRRKKQTIDTNDVSASSDVVLGAGGMGQVIDNDGETARVMGNDDETAQVTGGNDSETAQLTDNDGETAQVTGNDDETDEYECSECLGTYQQDVEAGNGAAWVKCGCGQWIHDECIYQSVTGEDRKERMCSNCVV